MNAGRCFNHIIRLDQDYEDNVTFEFRFGLAAQRTCSAPGECHTLFFLIRQLDRP